jgi:hypothetical protein
MTVPQEGRTVIRAQALRRIAQATLAELAGVAPSEVSVQLADVRGALAIEAATPIDLGAARVSGTLIERTAAITAELTTRFERTAERTVGQVRLRLLRLAGTQTGRRAE